MDGQCRGLLHSSPYDRITAPEEEIVSLGSYRLGLFFFYSEPTPGDRFLFSPDIEKLQSDSHERLTKDIKRMEAGLSTGRFQENTYSELLSKSQTCEHINLSLASLSLLGATCNPKIVSGLSAKSSAAATSHNASVEVASRDIPVHLLGSPRFLPLRNLPILHKNTEPSRPVAASDSSLESESQPLILASIRRVLSADPSYAEKLVTAVEQLPEDKRNLLFSGPQNESTEHCALSAVPLCGLTTADPTQLRASAPGYIVAQEEVEEHPHSQAPSGQPSSSGSAMIRTAEQEEVLKSLGDQSRKHPRSEDDDDNGAGGNNSSDDDGDGDGDGYGGGPPPPGKLPKPKQRLICPFYFAYGNILPMDMLAKCWRGFTERRDWKAHLKDCHSRRAADSDNELFYMDSIQWDEVENTIKRASAKRPRQSHPRSNAQKECFLAVWRIIFPKDRFPNLREPISPYHLDDSQVARLVPQIQALFDAIHNQRARRAVEAGTIESTLNYHPTPFDCREMMALAFAIVANSSIRVAQWLVNTPTQTFHDAAANHADLVTDQPGGTIAPLHAQQPIDAAAHEPPVGSEAMPDMEPLDACFLDQVTMTEFVPMSSISVPLFPEGTQVSIQVSPNLASQPTQQPGIMQIIYPQTFKLLNINVQSKPGA
ncbi:hypothetical protein F5X96DRAFT_622290 [Biscogniauxia mediterranea]|nr:hypothetical protein F5X96DRAFT_622290 [Biscogniauxia mediterranea]